MRILGIETSCDDTGIGIIEVKGDKNPGFTILSNTVVSQIEVHRKYGGVFPTLAKREHGKNIVPLLEKLLQDSKDALMSIAPSRENDKIKSIEDFRDEFSLTIWPSSHVVL